MAFKKGVVTNPKGRGTETEKQRKTAALLLSPYVEKAVRVINRQLDSDEPSEQQWAANMVFSYVFGKPKQEVDMSSQGQKVGILYVGTAPKQE